MIRLPNAVEPVGPDDRVQRHAGLARPRSDLAHELALERLLVELALAGDDGARGAHAGVEVQRVEDERRARLETRRRAPPTARRSARRRRPSSARRAGRAGSSAASASSRASSRATIAASAPFCGPNTAGARSNGVRTSVSTTIRAPPSPPWSSIAASAPAPPSVVAEPPTPTRIDLRARRRRGADQLAGAVGRGGPGVALVLGDEAEAGGRRHLDHGGPAVLDQPELALHRRGRADPAPRRRPSRRRAPAGAPPSCPRRRRRRGQRSGGISPARSSPRPIAPATSAARNVPLNESGATSTGRSGTAGILPYLASELARRCTQRLSRR